MHIEFSDLGKKYGRDWIFRNVSGAFEPGRHGITGRNGSGKSTLLQILSGFVTANEGSISWKKGDEVKTPEEAHSFVAVCSPMMELFTELLVSEQVELHHRMKPLRLSTAEVLESIELAKHAHKPIHQLSSGMQQRLKLALTLYSEASLFLFDEPCSNLDLGWSEWYAEEATKLSSEALVIVASNSQELELKPVNGEVLNLP